MASGRAGCNHDVRVRRGPGPARRLFLRGVASVFPCSSISDGSQSARVFIMLHYEEHLRSEQVLLSTERICFAL